MISYFRNLNFVFFGTSEFSVIILEKLISAGFIPEAVVCNPDRPVGRKKIITPPPIKKLLIEKFKDYKIKILQPENLQSFNPLIFQSFNPNFFIVAAYARIIPKEILKIPRLGSIGVHPSLLPKYRGSSPIQSAILNGDEITGTTLFLMDEKVDHGPILSQRELEFPISNFQFPILSQKLAELSADLLVEFLRKYENIQNYEKINGVQQDESLATYTKKFTTKDAFIEPADLAAAQQGGEFHSEGWKKVIETDRKIRALNPEPGVWTLLNQEQIYSLIRANNSIKETTAKKNKRVKLLEAEIVKNKLKLKKIQIEGKKPLVVEK